MAKKVGYLGPRGTFCEEAAMSYAQKGAWEFLPHRTIEDVFSSVCLGMVEIGIVPIENSCEGSVNQTLDLLAYQYDLKIAGEIVLPVRQNLLARPGVKAQEITRILSHPQALAQCRGYLSGNFAGADLVDTPSTAEAARQVAQSGEALAAVGTAGAARAYGLTIISPDINDRSSNETRFIVLSGEDSEYAENCKTSLIVNVLNRPGALYQVLKEFSLRGINLTKIESRPTRTKIGEYLFFIDFEGHRLEPRVKEAIDGLKTAAQEVRILGSYPLAGEQSGEKRVLSPTLEDFRQEIDFIDDQIIELLGRRTRLVEKVGEFKKTACSVRDPEREKRILEKLRTLAGEKGLNPTVVTKIYKILFNHFVSLQQKKIISK
ncbi:prephenate dehydratase [Desulfolucanica intricata]|uniref:prephenate dehydratase n=1 Tax=Desulfolucanica intricata TaxID=1285191 RepID=UPI000829A421|nr:prephenate dehydratase [Desulfolucanica intricata]